MDTRELVTVDEMAAILKVKKSWLYSHARQENEDEEAIPRVYVGKYIRFNPDAVLDWIEKEYNERD